LPVASITSTSFAFRVEQARSAERTQPIPLSMPSRRAVVRQTPPMTQPGPRFQQFRNSGSRQRHRWSVKMRRMPSRLSCRLVDSRLSTYRQTEGSGVTTVTSQPKRVRCLAVFQVRTHEVSLAGGNERAKNSSLGCLFGASCCSELPN
jgi:hypothetical protein